jgi:ATP-dependent helicase/nuclease subunit B
VVTAALRGLYTIPAGTPFLDALAAGLLDQSGGDPAKLSRMRIFLPTRRACQAMTDAFLRASEGRPLLLPRLELLGDIEPEDWHEPTGAAPIAAKIPPAISKTRRQLLLARLILGRERGMPPDQALKLADALGHWLDQVEIHGLDTASLAKLVPAEYAKHWEATLEFLRIVTEHWPAILDDEGVMDAAMRRRAIIDAQIAAWRALPPQTPVIAAGSTGSLPATANLMRAILKLPAGAVVLPGLDTGLQTEAWEALPDSHPQHGLGKLLRSLGVVPEAVAEWPVPAAADRHAVRSGQGRAALLRTAMLPSDVTPTATDIALIPQGLAGLMEVPTFGPEIEALVIALRLREFLEATFRGTAALVTADRGLARRVAAELQRWGIAIDDSAGERLTETPPGIFLRLVAEAAASGLAPVPLLALLKHPLAGVERPQVEALELGALRGPRPAPGIEGLRRATGESERDRTAPLIVRLEEALGPLLRLASTRSAPLSDWLSAHVAAAEAIATTPETGGADRLWAEEAGESAAAALDALLAAAPDFAEIKAPDYPAVFEQLLTGQTVRPHYGKHPRLSILGPLEARLLCPDLAILGGMNEGSWPPEPEHDPWMGRPMRRDFGLPLPEWRIGLAAHDFCQAATAPQVMMTRSERLDGTPTVASRWLARLELAARQATGKTGASEANPLQRGAGQWLQWTAAIDRPQQLAQQGPPRACPPLAARFRDISVTRVERWVVDPYGYYADAILRLRPLDPVDQAPDASDRGTLLHQALSEFIQSVSGGWPDDPESRLIAIGRRVFSDHLERPSAQAFWWPRFLRMAAWFVRHEADRRTAIVRSRTEHKMTAPLECAHAAISLSATMDRIDEQADGSAIIIDYKSGSLPAQSRIECGWPPQLPLEAALLRRNEAAAVADLQVWAVGGSGTGGKAKSLTKKAAPEAVADAAWKGLHRLIAQFSAADMPYLAEPRPTLASRYNDYRHLARVGGGGADSD